MTRAARVAAAVLTLSGGGLAAPLSAAAHPLAPALLEIVQQKDGEAPGRFAVRWRADAAATAAPRLARHCRETSTGSVRTDAAFLSIERRWAVDCGERGLEGALLAVDGLATDRRDALVRVEWRDGVVVRGLVRADAPAWRVPARAPRAAVLADHVRLGVTHLAAGPDHWLFVLGLLALLRGARAVVLTVSAFTAGHAATLSLAALGVVSVAGRPVEVAIAATLVALAWELTERRLAERRGGSPRRPSLLARQPAALAFGFGLVHGLGFAGALSELGLPAGEIPLALLGFNLGIEAGQLGLVAAWLLLRSAAAGLPIRVPDSAIGRLLRAVPGYALGTIGVFWMLDRAF